MLETFTCATFAPHVGHTFALAGPDAAPVDLVLTEAVELPASSPRPGRMPFSLEFRGPAATVYPQATYRLEHAELGAFDLFLVPVGADPAGVRYQAVFS